MGMNSDYVAIGFFIGICFMAAAVVALTILYFAGSNTKNKSEDNKKTAVKKGRNSGATNKTDLAQKSGNTPVPTKNSANPQRPEALPETAGLAINAVEAAQKSSAPKPESGSQKEANAESPKNGAPQPVPASNGAGQSGNQPLGPEKKLNHEKGATIKIVNAPGDLTVSPGAISPAQPNPASETPQGMAKEASKQQVRPPENSVVQDKPNTEIPKNIEVKEMKTESNTNPVNSPGQIEAEKSNTEQKANNSKPANTNADFSELFTEDTEESEVGKLAKELEEVDSQDILAESRDLISQIRRNKS